MVCYSNYAHVMVCYSNYAHYNCHKLLCNLYTVPTIQPQHTEKSWKHSYKVILKTTWCMVCINCWIFGSVSMHAYMQQPWECQILMVSYIALYPGSWWTGHVSTKSLDTRVCSRQSLDGSLRLWFDDVWSIRRVVQTLLKCIWIRVSILRTY